MTTKTTMAQKLQSTRRRVSASRHRRRTCAIVFVAAVMGMCRPDAAQADARSDRGPSGGEVAPESVGLSGPRLTAVDSLIRAAIANGASPGAALVIGRHGKIVRLRGYGFTDWKPGASEVTDSTLYDLASLTKAMGTATLIMRLVRDGELDLDTPIHRYLRTWPLSGLHGEITIRHLLAHSSGLPAGADMWLGANTRTERIAALASLKVRTKPGTERNYSDLGPILLAAIVEEKTGTRLDDLLRERVFGPLEMRDTRFNPLRPTDMNSAFSLAQIAPTELDTYVRKTLVHGVVHDLNAWALDGVAGHAGLFSSARDMAVFAQALLDAAHGGKTALFPTGGFNDWMQLRSFGRPLGWDVPGSFTSSAGRYFTRNSIGHTGFTGTSLWVDPERDVFVVLLTNRLNPSSANQKHIELRYQVHDAVQLAITDMEVTERQN